MNARNGAQTDWSLLLVGPPGAGKSQAILSLTRSEAGNNAAGTTVDTSALNGDMNMSMESGMLNLDNGKKARLVVAPNHERFDSLWGLLLGQADALLLLIDHSRETRLLDMRALLAMVGNKTGQRQLPVALGITHVDKMRALPLDVYRRALQQQPPAFARTPIPVMPLDPRKLADLQTVCLSLDAALEMQQRFGGAEAQRA